jgi:subtilase family serine protease
VPEVLNGNNTKASAAVRIGADLVVSALTVPAAAVAGETFQVSETTSNTGGGNAIGTTTRYYLSADITLDATDPEIGIRNVPALDPGGMSPAQPSLLVPAGTTAATYFVHAKADSANVVTEIVESNNVRTSFSMKVGPDLTVANVTAPATAAAGATISVGDTTRNQGGGNAPASTTTYFFSANALFDANDRPIGGRPVGAIPTGGTNTGTGTAQVPADTGPGTYFIIAMADGNAGVAESVESNNTSLAATVRVGPDLNVPTITAPATAAAGATISIGDTTRNGGAGPAPASTTTFYLSANATLDPSDTALGARTVSALAAGISESGSTPVQLPSGITVGTMYVIAKADGTDAILESNETNNASFGAAIRFGADLIVASLTVPATAAAGATIQVGDTTRNQGSGTASTSTTQFYLSANGTLDPSDTPVGARTVSALAGGVSESGSTPVQIPANTPTGTVYVLAKADAADAVGESLETNNISGGAIVRIGPDLTASGATAPAWATPGATIDVGATTRNQGAGTAGPSTTVFYLSNNALLDSADQSLGGRPVGSLNANAVDIGTVPVQIPLTTTTGLYFILAKADGAEAIVETNEGNNSSFAATVRIGADLTVSAVTAPNSAAAGSTINVSDTTTNPGTLGAGPSTTRFYLSTNILLDGADVLLGSRPVGALLAGASETLTTAITLPPGMAGSYFILAVADSEAVVVEVFENNNIRSRPIQIVAQ